VYKLKPVDIEGNDASNPVLVEADCSMISVGGAVDIG
jgi:hypothetical protein